MERLRIEELHRIIGNDHDLTHPDAPSMTETPAKAEAQISDSQYAGFKRTAIEPIRIEGDCRMRLHSRQEHQERNHGNKPHDELIRKMHDGVRHIANRAKRQKLVKAELGEAADDRAKHCAQHHCDFHIALDWTLLRRHALIRREENKVQHLEANREESTDAGQLQKQGYRAHVRFFRRLDRHHLAYKTIEERNACDRERANDETDEHERIPLRHTAELIDFSDARGVGNRIAAHKEQGFKQNITESVRSSAVHAHCRTDARTRDHVTDLADNMIGEQLNHIVFHDGVCSAVKCHQDADANQKLRSPENAEKRVNGNLRRIAGHEDAARERRRRIAVDEPAVHRDGRHIDAYTRENCPKSRVMWSRQEVVHEDIALHKFHDDAEKHKIAA